MSGTCAPEGVPVGELEQLQAALDAPGVTLSDVPRLLSQALGRPLQGSMYEDLECVVGKSIAKRTWLETFCRTPAPTPREVEVREEIRRLNLEADLARAALAKAWDLRDKRRPADLPSFPRRHTACVVDHGTCSVSDLRCDTGGGSA